MTHTKGPWRVIDRHPEYKKNGLPKGIMNPNLARFWVGAGETPWRGPEEVCPISAEPHLDSEANAHLIASAPELLAWLEAVVGQMKFERDRAEKIYTNGASGLFGMQENLLKIIAKAKGEKYE